MADQNALFNVNLSEPERLELIGVLEATLVETRTESRRTDNRAYRTELHHEQDVLKGLLAKLRPIGE
jgi:hypothetical protein